MMLMHSTTLLFLLYAHVLVSLWHHTLLFENCILHHFPNFFSTDFGSEGARQINVPSSHLRQLLPVFIPPVQFGSQFFYVSGLI